MSDGWLLAVFGAFVLLAGLLTWRWPAIRGRLRRWQHEELHARFGERRLELQSEFLAAGRAVGLPRGLRWHEADWQPGAWLARDRQTGLFLMLLPVVLRFEAIEGSDMEDVPAVEQGKQATAVFFFAQGRWQTQGKAVFNLGPPDTLRHFAAQYQSLDAHP